MKALYIGCDQNALNKIQDSLNLLLIKNLIWLFFIWIKVFACIFFFFDILHMLTMDSIFAGCLLYDLYIDLWLDKFGT